MTYEELVALYPSLDRVMDRLVTSIRAGFDADPMLEWALVQTAKIKNPSHRCAAQDKVRELVVILEEGS